MNEEITLDLRDFFRILRKRLPLIISITLISTIAVGALSFFVIPPTYEAKVSVVIGKTKETDSRDKKYDYNDVMMYQKLVKTYAEIGKVDSVAQNTIEKGKLNITPKELKDMIKLTPQADTQILKITVENKDANKAKDIADIFTEEFIEKAEKSISNGDIQVLDKAQVPEKPIKPKKTLNIAIAFFIGLMVSIGLAFLLEYMDNTIKTEEDIAQILDMPVMGVIPEHD